MFGLWTDDRLSFGDELREMSKLLTLTGSPDQLLLWSRGSPVVQGGGLGRNPLVFFVSIPPWD